MNDLSGKTTIVVGASRGLGKGIATAFAGAGAQVIAASRSAAPELNEGGAAITWEVTDAREATVPARLLDRYEPHLVVIVAGATPHMRPLRQQTWETFSVNWETDVQIAFNWLREILLKPMRPGGRVIVVSSGAALGGSPLSGGYAGAKATQRFITAYAQDEAKRGGLGLTFATVLPRFAPLTDVGKTAIRAYADRTGQSVEEFLEMYRESNGPPITGESAGAAMVELATADAASLASSYLLTGHGLQKL